MSREEKSFGQKHFAKSFSIKILFNEASSLHACYWPRRSIVDKTNIRISIIIYLLFDLRAATFVCVYSGKERRNQLNKVTVYSSIGRGQSTLSCFQAAKQKRKKNNFLHIHHTPCRWSFYAVSSIAQFSYFIPLLALPPAIDLNQSTFLNRAMFHRFTATAAAACCATTIPLFLTQLLNTVQC